MNYNAIIKENKKRVEELFAPYDPITGLNSPLKRFEFNLDTGKTWYLPMAMKENVLIKDILKYKKTAKQYFIDKANSEIMYYGFLETLGVERFDYDFEYWAYTTIKIVHKEKSTLVPFLLNYPQRKYLKKLEELRLAEIPIRIVLAKARQWGGSTLTEIYILWLQNVIMKGTRWNSAIVTDVENQARVLRAMYKTAAKNYPKGFGTITIGPFQNSSKNLEIKETETRISIGSMQQPDSIRSEDLKATHLSEVGSWKKTENKEPIEVIMALSASLPKIPNTIEVLESTAKGLGFFYKEFSRAINKESDYEAIFVAWWEIERYSRPVDNYRKLIDSFGEYEWFLWKLGATLEGINWYMDYFRNEMRGNEWSMKSEYPSTWKEAFQSKGRKIISPDHIENMREYCTEPLAKGQLFSDGLKGKDVIKNIKFQETSRGDFWIWAYPDKKEDVSNRYCVSVDIGGRTEKADYSVIRVFDRYYQMDGGTPEAIATWRGHVDTDQLGWIAIRIAEWYNHAHLIIEANYLSRDNKNTEGAGFQTIINIIAEVYDNIYTRTDPDKVKEGAPVQYGFWMSTASKEMVVSEMIAAYRDIGYLEYDVRSTNEADTFEYKDDGTMGAVDGSHDDIFIASAIGVWCCNHKMDIPKIRQKGKVKGKTIVSEATF